MKKSRLEGLSIFLVLAFGVGACFSLPFLKPYQNLYYSLVGFVLIGALYVKKALIPLFFPPSFSYLQESLATLKWLLKCVPLLIFTNLLSTWLFSAFFSAIPEEQFAVRSVKKALVNGHALKAALLSCLVAPIFEELIFRGVFQGEWSQKLGKSLGLLLSSLLFTLAHMHDYTWSEGRILINLFIFSLLLGTLYQKRKNLYSPILAHGLFNAFSFFSLWLFVE